MPKEVLLTESPPLVAYAEQAPRVWILIGPSIRGCDRWGQAPEDLLRQLRRVQPYARLWTMDLAGAGLQLGVRSPAHVHLLLEDLRGRLTQANVSMRGVGLIGFSLGALVATEWARRYRDEVGALVLLNPAMRPFTHIVRSTRLGLWPKAFKTLLGRDIPTQQQVPLRTALSQGIARWRYEASKRRPIGQVLLLVGQSDHWRDWRVGQRISRAWGAALRMHPSAGHDLLMDEPAWVARSIADWLLPVGHAAEV